MKIDKISLFNFGSYEGLNEFDTKIKDNRNIILVGGKNGAGKTTLFTAMRLCLYGFMSMGYKNINSYYNRAIIKLINNTAKLKKPSSAYVQIRMSIENGQDIDVYDLKRMWSLNETVSEGFIVKRNQIELSPDETADFEKYILSLIPPELFNLYFFDGEKIADFFMQEGGNTRIKDAFLTLCGYDIFDIMRKNFKRISSNGQSNVSFNEYEHIKEKYEIAKNQTIVTKSSLDTCKTDLDLCEADIVALEKDYSKKGGITQEEWNEKLQLIKEEEKKRENWNSIIKKWSNEIVPFIMIRESLEQVKQQIKNENDDIKYKNFCEILESEEISTVLSENSISLNTLKEVVREKYSVGQAQILDLSFEQSSFLLAQLNSILDFDDSKIEKGKRAIKRSINKSSKIRQELENSNISSVQEYMQNRAELFERKSFLLNQVVELEQELQHNEEDESLLELEFKKAQSKLEEELKQSSINDISAKSIIMLDRLQTVLYRKQISRVERFFRNEISTLMRKTHFIDDIHIDDDFNIHVYRQDKISINKLSSLLESHSEEQLIALLGSPALQIVKTYTKSNNLVNALEELKTLPIESIVLPIELDKTSFSNGEKQIFIMAIYHSLVQLCNHEIPFIIDTPFARIDTEHRHNISKYFFSKLRGQVFILSTNEEIDSDHVQIMKDNILVTYMLENSDNKRTFVSKNTYFEE